MTTSIKASRLRVPRSRGALSGFLLVILGAWAALIPFIGPAFNLAYTPQADSTWHWTSERGWLEVLPGVVAVLGGLLLLRSTSRLVTSLGAWMGAAAGAWLLVGPTLAPVINVNHERPDPRHGEKLQALDSLLFFYAIGAAMLLFAAIAIGRLSVHGVRDVKAAERRAAAAAAEEERLAEERRVGDEQRLAEQQRQGVHTDGREGDGRDGVYGETGPHDRVVAGAGVGAGAAAAAGAGRHEQRRDGVDGTDPAHDTSTRRLPQTEAGPRTEAGPQGPGQGQYPNQGQPNQGEPNQPFQGQPNQNAGQQYPGQQYPPPPPGDYPPSAGGQPGAYPPAEHTRH